MTLKNKDIAEGMYVTNGKDIWKVLDWNSKYTDCLLQKIDKNGNKMDLFVVAENYELYGDEKEPQIAWMNGDYCIEKRQIDAEQYFVDFYKDNKKFKESARKSLKESAKPINEKNVAKFVDELNEWCDDNIHFADLESAKYTREYGKLYDFEWGWDYSYGDKGLIKVWDNEGTLDWFEETRVKDFIVKLAKKYGWYAEPVTSDSDFTFDEL